MQVIKEIVGPADPYLYLRPFDGHQSSCDVIFLNEVTKLLLEGDPLLPHLIDFPTDPFHRLQG